MLAAIAAWIFLPGASFLCAQASWSLAVSGDSRNCGDIVMPAIAAGVHADKARFYWHLGDYRFTSDFDADMLAGPEYRGGKHLSISEYQQNAWKDFLAQQIAPFGDTPVFLAIGNHELISPHTRGDFLVQFADWLDTPVLRETRLRDDPTDHELHTYYHWVEGGVDFVTLDNASSEMLDNRQLQWFERTLARAAADSTVRTVVVGMHDALPDSLSAGHSMNESAQGERSGRRVYSDLVAFRQKTGKRVYVLASHSHFVMSDVYQDACHQTPADVLPGWIVGTAGAVRYRLPADTGHARVAHTDVYGYLLARVSADGEIQFEFKETAEGQVPPATVERYGRAQVHACFAGNKSDTVPAGPRCPGAEILP